MAIKGPSCTCDEQSLANSSVVETGTHSNNGIEYKYRRRICDTCGRRFTSVELIVPDDVTPRSVANLLSDTINVYESATELIEKVSAFADEIHRIVL